MYKKIFSMTLALVMVMLMTFAAVGTGTAFAAETEGHEYLYFEIPTEESIAWTGYAAIYCHIWVYGGDAFNAWQSKAEKCIEADTPGVYAYDLTAKNIALEENKTYAVIFSADTGEQTYDTLFSTVCVGDTLYCDGTLYENPQDSSKTALAAFWKNQDSAVYGPVYQLTSVGTVVGTCLPPNTTESDVYYTFLVNNYDNAVTYGAKPIDEICADIVESLGLSPEVARELEQTAAEVRKAASQDEPATPDEKGLLGDADGSEVVNVKDATLIQKYAASIETLTAEQLLRANVNGDTDVNVKDATAIQKYAASIETGFAIGQLIA